MIDEKKMIEERPEWLNPDCVGNEEYNKGWNACNKYWCNTIKRQPKVGEWIPCSERMPEDESYILVSFENYTMPDIARYEENDEGGTFYPGDDEETYAHYGLVVNAWMPLPTPYEKGE